MELQKLKPTSEDGWRGTLIAGGITIFNVGMNTISNAGGDYKTTLLGIGECTIGIVAIGLGVRL